MTRSICVGAKGVAARPFVSKRRRDHPGDLVLVVGLNRKEGATLVRLTY